MIEFDSDNKLIWNKLDNKKEAETFLYFLQRELGRHMTERSMTDQKKVNALREHNELLAKLWESAWERHRGDISDTESVIRKVKEYFGIG